MFPTEPFIRHVIGSYEPELCTIIRAAWDKLSRNPDRGSFDLKRTIAVNMHQNVMNAVRSAYADASEVRLLEGYETIRLLLKKQVVVRLKKMDRRGYTRAQPTQATLAFTNVCSLPYAHDEFPEIHTVDFGYVLNELETKIDTILVAARFGESVIWSYVANDDAEDAPVVGTISPPLAPASGTAATIIKLPVTHKDRKNDQQK
ncbi:hypothetical protein [Mesorhizobium sp. M0207]|uniref:hypothetical protein n=1 Tax=Mesorhizobium sp. M0207 TaxID=2956915 RepID=UPI0033353415